MKLPDLVLDERSYNEGKQDGFRMGFERGKETIKEKIIIKNMIKTTGITRDEVRLVIKDEIALIEKVLPYGDTHRAMGIEIARRIKKELLTKENKSND